MTLSMESWSITATPPLMPMICFLSVVHDRIIRSDNIVILKSVNVLVIMVTKHPLP